MITNAMHVLRITEGAIVAETTTIREEVDASIRTNVTMIIVPTAEVVATVTDARVAEAVGARTMVDSMVIVEAVVEVTVVRDTRIITEVVAIEVAVGVIALVVPGISRKLITSIRSKHNHSSQDILPMLPPLSTGNMSINIGLLT